MHGPVLKDRIRRIMSWRTSIGKDTLSQKISEELPLRAELFSIDQLERHARAIAATHQLASERTADKLLPRLAENEQVLVDTYDLITVATERNVPLSMPSLTCGRAAAVEPPERARSHHTAKQNAHPHGDDVIRGVNIEAPHTSDEKVGEDEVRKSPEHIHGRGRKTFAWRLGERGLKGSSHHAADKMGNGVCEKSAAEQVGCVVKPIHDQALLSRRSMISCVVPVSPILGKIRVML